MALAWPACTPRYFLNDALADDPAAPFGWVPGREGVEPLETLSQCALYYLNVEVTCRECNHGRVFNSAQLWEYFRRRERAGRLSEIAKGFHCGRCHTRARGRVKRAVVRIVAVTATPEPLDWPWPDEREWKRLVERDRNQRAFKSSADRKGRSKRGDCGWL